MDWNDIRNQMSNLTVYDLKAGVRKVQNGMSCWKCIFVNTLL